MGLLEGFDPFNFNPLSFGSAPGGAPEQDIAALLRRKGQQMGGLLSQDQQVPAAETGPFRMPSGVPSLNSAPLPEVITGAPGADDGPAMAFAPKPAAAAPRAPQGGLLSPDAGLAPAADLAAPEAPQPSMMGRIGTALSDNSGMLMGLGAGLAGAGSWGSGISRGLAGAAAGSQTDASSAGQNLTYQALLRKNVDPQIAMAALKNPKLLETLVAENFGHSGRDFAFRQEEAKRAQANTDRTHQLAVRSANRADEDKVPTSAQEYTFYLKNLAEGEKPVSYKTWLETKDGGGLSLNPVYGRNEEGKTVLLQTGKNGTAVESRLPQGVTLDGVDNATLQSDAERLNAGDPNVLKKYSNKGQGRIDLLRLNNEANRQREAKGQAPIDITQNTISYQGDTARERAAGAMEGRMAPASIEAQGAFKIAQNAADNLWRTNSVPLNKVIQMGQAATSNPELKATAVAYNTAVMTYSRAIAPTGVGTVDSQQHAREILDKADGPKATAAAFAQLAREVDMAHASPGIARQYFAAARKARLEGKPMPEMPQYQPAAPAASAPPPEAIAALRNDPRRAADFDAYYGAGSAQTVLGGR